MSGGEGPIVGEPVRDSGKLAAGGPGPSPSPAHLAAAAGSASTLGSEHTGDWVSNELITHSISHPDQGEISAVSPALLGEKDRKAAVEPLQTWWTGVQRGVAPRSRVPTGSQPHPQSPGRQPQAQAMVEWGSPMQRTDGRKQSCGPWGDSWATRWSGQGAHDSQTWKQGWTLSS